MRQPLPIEAEPIELDDLPRLSRDDCPTCQAQRDDAGRLPIGFCGPDCLGRRLRRGE